MSKLDIIVEYKTTNYFGCNFGNCDCCVINVESCFSKLTTKKIIDIILNESINITKSQRKHLIRLNPLIERSLKLNKIRNKISEKI